MMNASWAYYLITTLLLALLLYFPVAKMIWVLSVRRLERKTERLLSEAERQGQLTRARVIGALISLLFAALFNLNLLELVEGA